MTSPLPCPLRPVRVSAPGKVILHGEHAVVYGKLALAASLNLRTDFHIVPTTEDRLVLELPDVGLLAHWPLAALAPLAAFKSSAAEPAGVAGGQLAALQALAAHGAGKDNNAQHMAILSFLYLYAKLVGVQSAHIKVTSQLPIGAGLGSSAAFCVCVAAGCLLATGVAAATDRVIADAHVDLANRWAFEAEKIIHGQPSGIDNCISSFGGARRFALGQSEPLTKVPALRILLVNTNVPRSTKTLVARVREHHTLVPEVVDALLAAFETLSKQAEQLYAQLFDLRDTPIADAGAEAVQGLYRKLGYLIAVNQHLLNSVGVGHPSLDQVVSTASAHGLPAKLTGAGGGGCAWVLIPPGTDDAATRAVSAALEACGFAVWETSMGGPGVTEEAP